MSIGLSSQEITPITLSQLISEYCPNLSKEASIRYADILYKYSRQHEIDWLIPMAIFIQESRFNVKAINWDSKDFGIGQLNYRTIKNRKVDLGLLLTNEDYAISETLKLLAELRDKYDRIDKKVGRKWFTRYHSFKPSHRDKYLAQLERSFEHIKKVYNDQPKKRNKLDRNKGHVLRQHPHSGYLQKARNP